MFVPEGYTPPDGDAVVARAITENFFDRVTPFKPAASTAKNWTLVVANVAVTGIEKGVVYLVETVVGRVPFVVE